MPVGPPVPPKPSTPIMNGERLGEYGVGGHIGNGDVVPERRGILPASLREKINQKKELEGRATPSIEPDLVGRDRYDKASRCFSYVPAKSMQEAFERPRRTSFSRAIEKRENSVENVSQEEVARTEIPQSYQQNDISTPAKWDEQVEDAKQSALLEELARAPSAMQHNYWGNGEVDNVQVVDQAQRAVITPTSTLQRRPKPPARSGSYRTLNDDAYCSDMDELCDPEYYLNYNSNTAPLPPPRRQEQHAGTRSVQLPRKKMNFDAVTDPLDDVLESTKRLGSAYSVGDVRGGQQQQQEQHNASNDFNFSNTLNNTPTDYRQHYRNRNCQSVTTPRNHHFSTPSREQEADAADTWLSGKLKKVRSKRDIDPDIVRRRTQEKMLLEELKDSAANNDENQHNLPNGHARGAGLQNIDPLAEFRREEERLRNTRSPYGEERWRGRMRGKPPTPPPRESSASPVNSLPRGTPAHHMDRQRHNQSVPLPMHHRQFDEDFDVNSLFNFSHDPRQQSTTLERGGRSLSRGARIQDAYYASQQDLSANNRFNSGQERVAAAIYRAETAHRDMYASGTINRAETPGRYFPENSAVLERSSTPSFPVSRATPLPFHPLLYNNGERGGSGHAAGGGGGGHNGYSTMNNRSASPRLFGGSSTLSRRSSVNSVDTSEIIHHHPLFVKDTSKYWYKPTISREQAINMLRDKPPGTFVVRDSNSFPGAFGLALKVSTPPPGVNPGDGSELVRHFLIEPSPKGVKLKGCNNEPVFGSLSALVYQHSITALALPTKLVLPDFDPAATPEHLSATQALLEQGAACNVVYVGSVDVESLTGNECVKRSIATCSQRAINGDSRAVSVHFKVSSQGVTLTDNTRKVFFRRHFNVQSVIFAGMDPIERRFENTRALGFHDGCIAQARLFAFVARIPSSSENACHVFAELEPEQPGSAVVNFINKVMLAQKNRS
ncbi:Tensin homolog [Caenorhabditis elegans]|nr:Tensin homolog [Caenorhabditis elegans]CCD71348.1 Tensin homolog [Caenorhabditis elegans]|eukprot:NP_491636.1 TeNSin homolog [Caenorhabditis elegans]